METPEKQPGKAVNLSRWFWGAILVMAVLTLGMTVMALLRHTAQPEESTSTELTGATVSVILTEAQKAAFLQVSPAIETLLEEVYAPVYAAIPAYANFHYSVPGQYLELAAAVTGAMEQDLQDRLFAGFDGRMSLASTELTDRFNQAFQREVDTAAPYPEGASTLGDVTRNSLADAKARFIASAPLSATAAVGSALAVKTAVKVLAKKMGGKLAVKAAAKAGSKWAAAGTMAGAGALACSWTGPGAGICAAAGGVGAWFLTDFAMVKLDELWSREEFEAYLRTMVDEQKAAHAQALREALEARAADTTVSDKIAQDHDFTLMQLSAKPRICAMVNDLKARYEPLRDNLAARSPEALSTLREAMAVPEGDSVLGPMVRELAANLDKAERARLTAVQIKGNLAEDHRANRDISGQITLNGQKLSFDRTGATESGGFTVYLAPDAYVALERPIGYDLAIEQHLWRSNRFFGSSGELQFRVRLHPTGLSHRVTLPISLAHDEVAVAIGEVNRSLSGGTPIEISLSLQGDALPALTFVPDCP